MDRATYEKTFNEDNTPGWQAIDDALAQTYGGREPRHYGPLCGLHYVAGGEDPIDGASIYDCDQPATHHHIVSYGMSELYYNPESTEGEFSKWGFEFTFRIKPFAEDEKDPIWAIQVMNNLARYVFNSGKWFEPYHFVPANEPIRLNTDTSITGLAFVEDPVLGVINTPHGEVTFLQMVGLTNDEVERLKANPSPAKVAELVNLLQKDNPLLITDLERK